MPLVVSKKDNNSHSKNYEYKACDRVAYDKKIADIVSNHKLWQKG